MPSTAPPQDRIRAHLEGRGGTTRVELRKLARSWGIDTPTAGDGERIAADLGAAGISVFPPIAACRPETVVTLRIRGEAAPAAPRRVPPSAPVADAPRDVRPVPAPRAPVTATPPAPEHVAPPAPSPARAAERPARRGLEALPVPGAAHVLVAGAAIVVLALFLPWFAASSASVDVPARSSGWEWLTLLDLALLALAGGGATLALRPPRRVDIRTAATALAAGATLAAVAVIGRATALPDDLDGFVVEVDRRIGPLVALAGVGLLLAGAALVARGRPRPAG